MKRLSIIPLLVVFSVFCTGQEILKQSGEYLYPFEKINSEVLKNHVAELAKGNRVLGLGESSHFTRECYEIKHQIIKTLIEKGYEGLVLEVDFGQALIWNDYVTKGIGNLDSIIAESGWFTYRTEEFKNIIQDIKNHNENAPQVFQIFGMEMTAINHNVDWLVNYFSKNVKENQELLKYLRKDRKTIAFQKYDEEERQEYWKLFYQVSKFLKNNKEELIENGGAQEYSIALKISEIFRQFAAYISQDEFLLKVELRDQFSARNVVWVLEHLGEDSQIILWAHNGHVTKESVMFNYDVLGHYLSKWFEKEYYAIGFTFNQGTFGAFSDTGFRKWKIPSVDRKSITKDFQKYSKSFLLFDIRSNLENDNKLNSYLRTKQLIRTDVSESFREGQDKYMEINLSKTYDALIYIYQISCPRAIDWKQ